MIVFPLFSSCFAYLTAYATACELSNAGIIPSVSHNNLKAFKASLSVIGTYFALPLLCK